MYNINNKINLGDIYGKIKLSCEMDFTLKLIGGKYKLLILYFLLEDEKKRFNELLSAIGSISKKTLTNQLRELEMMV